MSPKQFHSIQLGDRVRFVASKSTLPNYRVSQPRVVLAVYRDPDKAWLIRWILVERRRKPRSPASDPEFVKYRVTDCYHLEIHRRKRSSKGKLPADEMFAN